MDDYIYRNYTVEYLFDKRYVCSGYGDVTKPSGDFDNYIIFYQLNPSSTPEEQKMEIESIKSKISYILNSEIRERIIIFSLFRDVNKDWEMKSPELLEAIDDFNLHFLKQHSEQYKNVKIVDINTFYQSHSIPFIDWRFFFTAQMVINPKLDKPFKKWFEKQMEALDLKRKKCIVLDCDNTLWGGVVGEDGTFGIKLGMDYPGNCFKRFQHLLLSLSKKGVILAICSKNNLKDVLEVWENNPHNIINDKVLSAYRINWQDKASNIKSIAEELNIGTDSFVFIDDNPLERGLIKELLPEVEVPDFPEKPYELVDFFWQIYHNYFFIYELSEEDLKKTEQYKENFFRNESKKAFTNIDDYLASLNIEIDIMKANKANLPRIAQMTQKTNQFNLTTKRYTEEKLREMIEEGADIYCANVKDRFGDNGITIAAIFIENDKVVHLDSYLLSCRILGREIEKVTLLKLIEEINRDKNKPIKAQFIPTKKNSIAADFLDNIGFVHIKTDEKSGTKDYIFDLNKKPTIKTFYKIKFI